MKTAISRRQNETMTPVRRFCGRGSWLKMRSANRPRPGKKKDAFFELQGKVFYPAFQFGTDGQPLEVIKTVLSLFKVQAAPYGWRTAGWFFANNGWLGGAAPKDLLKTAPDRVIEAAKHKIAEPGY